jgi:hypothetical protein
MRNWLLGALTLASGIAQAQSGTDDHVPISDPYAIGAPRCELYGPDLRTCERWHSGTPTCFPGEIGVEVEGRDKCAAIDTLREPQ